jgi:hypothetical protein
MTYAFGYQFDACVFICKGFDKEYVPLAWVSAPTIYRPVPLGSTTAIPLKADTEVTLTNHRGSSRYWTTQRRLCLLCSYSSWTTLPRGTLRSLVSKLYTTAIRQIKDQDGPFSKSPWIFSKILQATRDLEDPTLETVFAATIGLGIAKTRSEVISLLSAHFILKCERCERLIANCQ